MRTARKAAILNSEQFCVTQASDTQFQSGVQSRKFIKAVHNSPLHIPIAQTNPIYFSLTHTQSWSNVTYHVLELMCSSTNTATGKVSGKSVSRRGTEVP